MPWAAIIPAVASLAAAGIGAAASSSSASANRDAQFQMNESNIAHQREFAQHGIRWKTEDAKAAGIHPLFAMGAQTHSFSPSTFMPVDDTSGDILSRGISSAGQDIGRAVASTQTKNERANGITSALALERQQLENDLIRSQIARNLQVGPGFPRAGGGMTGDVNSPVMGVYKPEPTEVPTAATGTPGIAAGPYGPQVRFAMSPDAAGFQSFPVKGLFSDEEITSPAYLDWYIRNRILPNVDSRGRGPTTDQVRQMFPGATGVVWDHINQRWQPTYAPGRENLRGGTWSGMRHGQYRRGNPLSLPMPSRY